MQNTDDDGHLLVAKARFFLLQHPLHDRLANASNLQQPLANWLGNVTVGCQGVSDWTLDLSHLNLS